MAVDTMALHTLIPNTHRPQRCLWGLLAILLLCACATSQDGQILKVRPERVGYQNMPSEIMVLMQDLGYERQTILDREIDQPVYMLERQGMYEMLFQAPEAPAVKIEVWIRVKGGNTRLRLYEPGRSDLSPEASRRYRELEQQLTLRFGAAERGDGLL